MVGLKHEYSYLMPSDIKDGNGSSVSLKSVLNSPDMTCHPLAQKRYNPNNYTVRNERKKNIGVMNRKIEESTKTFEEKTV